MLAAHIRQRRQKFLLLGGEPGDRFFLAHRLANELGGRLVETDARMVTRETEDDLQRLLERARAGGAVLFFDEADSLFTARGEPRRETTRAGRQAEAFLRALGRFPRPVLLGAAFDTNARRALERVVNVAVSFPGQSTGSDGDPHPAQHFRVTIGDRELGFSHVGPLQSDDAPAPAEPTARERPWAGVVLRRALTASSELFAWRQAMVAGKDDRRVVMIELLDRPDGQRITGWKLSGAWPVRWCGPRMDATATSVAMEEVELSFDEVEWL